MEFIALLARLGRYCPRQAIIRVVLDKHSAHSAKETRACLGSRPDRFDHIHTPKHRSWLSRIGCAFSKRARTLLRRIRVKSIQARKARILIGVEVFHGIPVSLRWNRFDLGVA